MTPEQRRRAGRAVAERIREMNATISAVARAARVDPGTLWGLIGGRTWPRDAIQTRIEEALGWDLGEILVRAAIDGPILDQWLRLRCLEGNSLLRSRSAYHRLHRVNDFVKKR